MHILAQNSLTDWPLALKRLLYLLLSFFLVVLIINKASLAIITAVIIIGAIYAFARKDVWLLLALSVTSLVFGEIIFIPVTVNWIYEARIAEILLIITAAVYLLDIYLNAKYEKVKIDKISFLLFAYMILSIVSFTYTIDQRLFVFGIKVPVFAFLAYFLSINLLNSYLKLKTFLYGVALAALVLSIQIFVKFYQMGFSTKFFFERNLINIPIGPIATTAAILSILALVVIGFYFQLRNEKDKFAPFVLGVAAICFVAVFLTLGKAAIASLLIGLLYILFKIKKSRLPIILLSGWFIVITYLFLNPYLGGLFERIQTALVDTNTQFRILEYKTSWKVIEDHYLIGVGAGQQLLYFNKMLEYANSQAQLVNNYFVQVLIDLGVIGLFLFSLIFWQIFKLTRINIKPAGCLQVGFTAALICAMINGLAEVTLFALPYAICFWFLLGAFKSFYLTFNPSPYKGEGGNEL